MDGLRSKIPLLLSPSEDLAGDHLMGDVRNRGQVPLSQPVGGTPNRRFQPVSVVGLRSAVGARGAAGCRETVKPKLTLLGPTYLKVVSPLAEPRLRQAGGVLDWLWLVLWRHPCVAVAAPPDPSAAADGMQQPCSSLPRLNPLCALLNARRQD